GAPLRGVCERLYAVGKNETSVASMGDFVSPSVPVESQSHDSPVQGQCILVRRSSKLVDKMRDSPPKEVPNHAEITLCPPTIGWGRRTPSAQAGEQSARLR